MQIYESLDQNPDVSQKTFDLIDNFIAGFGEAGLADGVVNLTPQDVPWSRIADVLAIMIWSTSCNGGTRIMRDAERWLLDRDDERRAYIALHLDVYPFLERMKMEEALLEVAQAFPALAQRCTEMIGSRKG